MSDDDSEGHERRKDAQFEAEVEATAITDPATWEAARALNRAREALIIRLAAGEITENEYNRGLDALLDAADWPTVAASWKLIRAMMRSGDGKQRPPDA